MRSVIYITKVDIREVVLKDTEKELDNLIEVLKSMGTDEIISRAYEIATKKDILLCLEENRFNFPTVKFLYDTQMENILDYTYNVWEDCEKSHMEEMQNNIEEHIQFYEDSNYEEFEVEENSEEMEM